MREGRFLVLHEADWLMKSLGQDDRFLAVLGSRKLLSLAG